jgi:Fe-S-cluster containining protein
MPVEVKLSDLQRLGLVEAFEAQHIEPKHIAVRLQKAKRVERYNSKSEKFTLTRRADGDCQYLDERTRLCTVYEQRPDTCRLHPQVGPRPDFCPHGAHRPHRNAT